MPEHAGCQTPTAPCSPVALFRPTLPDCGSVMEASAAASDPQTPPSPSRLEGRDSGDEEQVREEANEEGGVTGQRSERVRQVRGTEGDVDARVDFGLTGRGKGVRRR